MNGSAAPALSGGVPCRDGERSVGALWRHLRTAPLETWAWRGLAAGYARARLPWQFGYAATQAVRCDPVVGRSLRELAAAIPAFPERGSFDICADMGEGARVAADDLSVCLRRLEAVVGDADDDWLSWVYLARCIELLSAEGGDTGRGGQKRLRDAVRKAVSLEPIAGETGYLLARWRFRSGDAEGALRALQATLQQAPGRSGSWLLQARALFQFGQLEAGLQSLRHAGKAQNPDIRLEVARTLFANNCWQEAIGLLENVVETVPAHVAAWRELAGMQMLTWQSAAARRSWEKILGLLPRDADAQRQLSRLAQESLSGRTEFDQRLAVLNAGTPLSGSEARDLLMESLYQDHLGGEAVAALHQRIAGSLFPALPTRDFGRRAAAGNRLRIGYVTGDLHRQHPVNIFMLPVLERHDREMVATFVYYNGQMHDEFTLRARSAVDGWREVASWDDATLHRAIRNDHIDVLVDLAGFTNTNRLGVFVARSAPVQMTYLGYPHSTGLKCMDWIIADGVVAPEGDEALFSEKVARLPGPVFCWEPTENFSLRPDTGVGIKGPVAFGSFNNLKKLSARTVTLWSRVMASVPDSILLLKAPQLLDPAVRDQVLGAFAKNGVEASRIDLREPAELGAMMDEYHDVHIALDPFPYNGGTTSLQALWMGCPLVTLAGSNFVSRMGASFLTSLGRREWIAQDDEDYIRIAAALAKTMRTQVWRRHALREAMRSSPLCDVEGHVRAMEASYRATWEEYAREMLEEPA